MCRAPARLRCNAAASSSRRTASASLDAITLGRIAKPNRSTEFLNEVSINNAIGRRELKQAGDFQSADPGNGSGKTLHLVGQFLVNLAGSFVHRGADKVLQHLLIFIGKNLRLDLYFQHLLLPVHFYSDHAAAGRSFDRNGVHLPLQVFLYLPQPGKHLLKSVDFHQETSSRRFTSEIFPPKRCNIERTIGSRSNFSRNSLAPSTACDAFAAVAATASILAHTRTERFSTVLATARIFSSESRPSIISE